jgi:beta-aspartyl-peptidase (threonine type)
MTERVPAIIVHGGAGAGPAGGIEEVRAGMRAATQAGWEILSAAGSALDAVEAAVRVLEDHPRFNAGCGAVLTADGTVELDASIMEGTDLRCGAVAAVTGVPNPVSLARRVLEDGRHVFLVGGGALRFAASAGVPRCPPEALITEPQRARWLAAGARSPSPASVSGTVGAVALDRAGTVAAATSTGGVAGQLAGRVGDSALIGCGTCADSTIGGVSCTGSGEAIIRVVLARRALDLLKEAGDPDYAARAAVDLLVDEGRGQGGLIVLDWRGRTGFATSTPFMPVAWRSAGLAEPVLGGC